MSEFYQKFEGKSRFESHERSFKFSCENTKNTFNKFESNLGLVSVVKRILGRVRNSGSDFGLEWERRGELINQFVALIRRLGSLGKQEVAPLSFYEFYLSLSG